MEWAATARRAVEPAFHRKQRRRRTLARLLLRQVLFFGGAWNCTVAKAIKCLEGHHSRSLLPSQVKRQIFTHKAPVQPCREVLGDVHTVPGSVPKVQTSARAVDSTGQKQQKAMRPGPPVCRDGRANRRGRDSGRSLPAESRHELDSRAASRPRAVATKGCKV